MAGKKGGARACRGRKSRVAPPATRALSMAVRTQRNSKMLASLKPGSTGGVECSQGWVILTALPDGSDSLQQALLHQLQGQPRDQHQPAGQQSSAPPPHAPLLPPASPLGVAATLRRMAEHCGMTTSVSEQEQHHDVHPTTPTSSWVLRVYRSGTG